MAVPHFQLSAKVPTLIGFRLIPAHRNSIFAPVPIPPLARRRTGSSQRKSRSARRRSSDVCPQRIVVRVILLDHTDKPLAAKGVNPLALRIEIHVVPRSPPRD